MQRIVTIPSLFLSVFAPTPTMPTFSELIRSEEEVLKRLMLVSQRQLELVEEGDFTVLVELLWRWQQLWKEFELLEQQLVPYKNIPAESRVWKNAAERQTTESALNRSMELLGKILENYQVCMTKTAVQKDEVETQLRRVQRGGNASRGYLRNY